MTPPLPTITQDTREPSLDSGDHVDALFRPCVYRGGQRVALPVTRQKLDAADYSLPGLCDTVAFERKSVSDLLGTLFGATTDSVGSRAANLDRFRAELLRLQSYAFRRVVVEGTPGDVVRAVQNDGRRFDPRAALALIWSLDTDYGVPFLWAGNRAGAEALVGATLARIWEQATDEKAAQKARGRGVSPPWLGVLVGVVEPVVLALLPEDAEPRPAVRVQLPPVSSYQRRKSAPAGSGL